MSATGGIADIDAFIRENTRLLAPSHAPELKLHLADDAIALWALTEEQREEIGLPPPFWAFAWAGGQALARYVLDMPEIVAGKSVLDMPAGSGIVGIAAMKAGAARVRAVDIDMFAVAATRLNAAVNDVLIDVETSDPIGAPCAEEVILVGDLFYERDLAERLHAWLASLHAAGKVVLIGDPGRTYLPKHALETVAEYEIPVSRALEDDTVKRTAVWRFKQ